MAAGDLATDTPFKILDGIVTETTVRKNQRVAPDDLTADNHVWESLGEYQIDNGSLAVVLHDKANGTVVADAIRIVWLGP
jgi:hypothetical protein